MKTELLFRVLPYAACALCAGGLLVRAALGSDPQAADGRIASLPPRPDRARLWRLSFFLLFVGHLLAVVSPRVILLWNTSLARLYALEVTGLLVGISALAGGLRLWWRHFTRRGGGRARALADAALLSCLLLALASGVLTALGFRWGSTWATATLTPYLLSLGHGAPDTALVARLPPLVQLHVVSAFAALAVLPFTSVAALVVLAVRRRAERPLQALAGAARALEAFARRHGPAGWLWPDEDYGGPLPAVSSAGLDAAAALLRPEPDATEQPAAKGP